MRRSLETPSNRHGMALVVTLAVLLMVTVIVVTFAVIVRMETASARGSFESERAMQFSQMAVDEAMAKLRDHIPLDSHWAAGPGRLYAYKNGGWMLTELFSGKAAGSTTGSVALNAPFAGMGGSYPILSPNAEHPTPNPMKVAWINVLRDGTRSVDADYAERLTADNPIVGRYAWWMDTETSKVNLNTAGLARVSYNLTMDGVGDVQNLSGHPSRVDLSKLDEAGGVISSALGRSTYEHTASSFWQADQMTQPQSIPIPARRVAGEGMKRFNSINDWMQIGGVTSGMIEANKFNLTTLARTPELNPWGYNKWWWQNNAPQRFPSENKPGNRLNAPGPPVYSEAMMQSPPKFMSGLTEADTRYYVYPAFLGKSTTDPVTNTISKNSQWLGSSAGTSGYSSLNFQNFMTYSMELLSRRDWPGMPPKSFVDKYGREECEALAVNLMYLFDSTVGGAGQVPWRIAKGSPFGVYGEAFYQYTRPDGSTHFMSGIGPWPYLNEIGVRFSATRSGWTPNSNPNPAVIEYPNTAITKSQRRPGFAKPVDAANYGSGYLNYMNIAMNAQAELFYPSSLGRGVAATNFLSICDVEVIASGTLNGQPVTYSGADYIWGRPDDNSGQYRSGFGFTPTFTPSNTPVWWNWNGRIIYIGPFDYGSTPHVTLKLRTAFSKQNKSTYQPPTQVAPLPPNDTPDPINETPDDVSNPRKFIFTCNDFALTEVNTLLSKWESYEVTDPRVYRYVSDWKKSTHPSGHTLGAANSGYVTSAVDPLTGVKGDFSKFAWPDVTLASLADYRNSQIATQIANLPGIGWLSILSTNTESSRFSADSSRTPGTYPPVPWRTLNFGPATNPNELPDWLLIDVFAMAYEHTYLSQSQGKINLNAEIYPFDFARLAPLKALLIASSANGTTDAGTIARDIAEGAGINSGPCSNLPPDTLVYAGQVCQVASLQGTGANQFQKEALIRDIAGLVTTQCSDFRVYVIAQALNPQSKPVAEQRISALISRTVNVGSDEVPATADDPIQLKYDGTDAALEGGSGRPPFRFQLTQIQHLNK